MSRRSITLEQLQQVMRVELCGHCPYRSSPLDADELIEPLPCEAQCPVFAHLPALKATAERLDPLVGCHERTLLSEIDRIVQESGNSQADRSRVAALRRHRRRLARRLGKMLNR